jgi:DNA-binding MarR family transcriptional regulator
VSGTCGVVDATDLLRTLLDPDRLAVLGCIARAPRTTAQVGAATGVAERDVLRTLGPLVQEGYVRRVEDPAGADPVA